MSNGGGGFRLRCLRFWCGWLSNSFQPWSGDRSRSFSRSFSSFRRRRRGCGFNNGGNISCKCGPSFSELRLTIRGCRCWFGGRWSCAGFTCRRFWFQRTNTRWSRVCVIVSGRVEGGDPECCFLCCGGPSFILGRKGRLPEVRFLCIISWFWSGRVESNLSGWWWLSFLCILNRGLSVVLLVDELSQPSRGSGCGIGRVLLLCFVFP